MKSSTQKEKTTMTNSDEFASSKEQSLPFEKQFEFSRIMNEVESTSDEQKTELIRQLLFSYLYQQEMFKEIYSSMYL